MIWDNDADELLMKLWKDGGSLKSVSLAMGEAGYAVSRNAIAGRRHRLVKEGVEMPSRSPEQQQRIHREATASAPRRRPVSEQKPASTKPVTIEQIEKLSTNDGVDYLKNEGCKALLDKRSGKWKLQMCCGKPFGLDYNGSTSSYCPTHFRLFTNPQAGIKQRA
jgi:hypothetical protein